VKTIISRGTVISMDDSLPRVQQGDIAVEDRRIVSVGSIPSGFEADRTIDAEGSIVLPGLVNAHCHLSMVLLRNYADDLDLFTWLNEKIWPIEAEFTREHIYNASFLGIAELIRSGVTSFADMYFFPEETCRVVEKAGIRANIAAGFIGDLAKVERLIPEFEALHKNWNGKAGGRIVVDTAPHSAYLLTPDALRLAMDFARRHETRIHIHISETLNENEQVRKEYGLSPVEYLEREGLFNFKVYAAHCVHVSERDLEILKKYGVVPVHNPSSNLKLGSGISPVSRMFAMGIRPALGTDGASSNNNLNMLEEIHLAALIHKGSTGDPTAVSAYQALQMATIFGARALGIDHLCGSLTPGKEADLILVDTHKAHILPLHDPLSSLTYGAQASDIHFCMCAGQILMEDGEIKTFDEEFAMKRACGDAAALMGEE
jgi:5-methylthioadenosine/S-adenosylhomocysteine deaminase